MPLDHVGIAAADFGRSRTFYTAALAALGYSIVKEGDDWALIGVGREPELWFGVGGQHAGPIHLAFTAATREQVRALHAAALAAGGRDNGGPGLREQYHPDYYGTFVLDPNGHNIEAVCHTPEG